MIEYKVFFCPVSIEATEAVFYLSHEMGWPLGLVASLGQVGPFDKGYTGFDNENFQEACENFRLLYPRTNVCWCRDHLGKGDENVYSVINRDQKFGVSCTHLHTLNPEYALNVLKDHPDVQFEVGPGEADATPDEIDALYRAVYDLPNFAWLSFPTGCRINSLGNDNNINGRMLEYSRRWVVRLRGHNSDYASDRALITLHRYIDGINIAPQFGVIQSCVYLTFARMYGLDVEPWELACWRDERNRKRWAKDWNVTQAVGHYHFDSLNDELRTEARPLVMETLLTSMRHYYETFTRG